jgi:hypothetical protein
VKLKTLSLAIVTVRPLLEEIEVAPLDEQIVAAHIQEIEPTRSSSALKACFDGTDYWLFDGYHRLEAMKRLGFNSCLVQIYKGSRRDAIRHYIKNKLRCAHTKTFKHCLQILTEDQEWSNLDTPELARLFDRKQVFFKAARHLKSHGWPDVTVRKNKHGTLNLSIR